jgi:hypothetical protein
MRKKLNKTVAGYHILMILSAVDFKFHIAEELVIRDWLVHEFPFTVNLDSQMDILSKLLPKDWEQHFENCINDYFEDATQTECIDILLFAKKLIEADEIVYHSEQQFYIVFVNHWKAKGIIATK